MMRYRVHNIKETAGLPTSKSRPLRTVVTFSEVIDGAALDSIEPIDCDVILWHPDNNDRTAIQGMVLAPSRTVEFSGAFHDGNPDESIVTADEEFPALVSA